MPINVFEELPKSLQRDLKILPKDLIVNLLQDAVSAYKMRIASYKEAEEILQEVEEEVSHSPKETISPQAARQRFLDIRNTLVTKYFREA